MVFLGNQQWNGETFLRRAGFVLLALFFLSVFTSKALVNALGVLSVVLSLAYIWIYDRKIVRYNRYLLLFIVPYLVGFLLSFLSYSGVVAAIVFLDRFKFMLLMLPLITFVNSRKDFHILLAMFFISAMIAIGYGLYTEQPYGLFQGVHTIGRTADMMVVASLTAFVYFSCSKFTVAFRPLGFKLLMAFIAVICAWAVLMSEMRASWLGFSAGIFCFICLLLLVGRKALIFNTLVLTLFFTGIVFLGMIKDNFSRISQQVESIVVTHENESNEARLHLLKTGWDFSKEHFLFGTGAKQSEELFIDFFNSQPEEYQEKYHYAINYPGNFHNSYMQVYIETGGIFFLFYMMSIIYPLFAILKRTRRAQVKEQTYLIATLVACTAFLVTQIFHGDLYHYGSTAFYLILFSGCYVLNKNKQLL